jgi:nickel-dependent lactate racemase
MPILSDPARAFEAALASPVGSFEVCRKRPRRSACILICDITCPVPNGLLLPSVAVVAAGLRPEAICVLATGLHRPNEGAESRAGRRPCPATVRVENHFARNDEDHVFLGTTRSGTVVKLDRRFVEADSRSSPGWWSHAGYSGGRKDRTRRRTP